MSQNSHFPIFNHARGWLSNFNHARGWEMTMRQKLTMCVVEFLAHFHVRVRECARTGTFLLLMSSGEGEREELGRRSFWVQPWIGGRRQLFVELCNGASFKNFMRIPPEMFDELGPRITMQPWLWDQVSLNAIWIEGASQHHSLLNPEVCYNAIIDEYKDDVMKSPSTREEWRVVSDMFMGRWNLPRRPTCGALNNNGRNGSCLTWLASS